MICQRCKFAEWDRTISGRLSPTGMGRCTWKKTFRVAGTASGNGYIARRGEPITVEGSFICRKKGEEFPTSCEVFQPVSGGTTQ